MKNQTKWSIDQAHSEISFKVRHLMIAHVRGTFKTYDATIYTTEKDFSTAVIDLRIDASSINTGDAKRDEHLKSIDFFDVQNNKQLLFKSGKIERKGSDGNYELWGELTMKGITNQVKLNVEFGGIITDPWGKEKAGFTVSGKINRSDWGLNWNTAIEAGGLMVSEEVTITCEIELVNAGQKGGEMEMEAAVGERAGETANM